MFDRRRRQLSRSRGARVPAVQAAEVRHGHDTTRSILDVPRLRRIPAKRLMAARRVVVLDVLAEHGPDHILAERDDVVWWFPRGHDAEYYSRAMRAIKTNVEWSVMASVANGETGFWAFASAYDGLVQGSLPELRRP